MILKATNEILELDSYWDMLEDEDEIISSIVAGHFPSTGTGGVHPEAAGGCVYGKAYVPSPEELRVKAESKAREAKVILRQRAYAEMQATRARAEHYRIQDEEIATRENLQTIQFDAKQRRACNLAAAMTKCTDGYYGNFEPIGLTFKSAAIAVATETQSLTMDYNNTMSEEQFEADMGHIVEQVTAFMAKKKIVPNG